MIPMSNILYFLLRFVNRWTGNFWRYQKSQQAIVVTHNPNIPVNGAAEQIVHMDFKRGQIVCQSSGALQNIEIRGAVCDVMEGGREALRNRYYRISQALE